jgi:hypothetical protein
LILSQCATNRKIKPGPIHVGHLSVVAEYVQKYQRFMD